MSANLGMSYSIANVLAEAGYAAILRWVPLDFDEQHGHASEEADGPPVECRYLRCSREGAGALTCLLELPLLLGR